MPDGANAMKAFTLPCFLLFLSCAFLMQAQNGGPSEKTLSAPLSYEVASVRLYKPHGSPNIYISSDSHSFSANLSVAMLLQYAFGVLMADEISGVPAWARSEQYAIEAKIDAKTSEQLDRLNGDRQQQELRKMMQSLLADRFDLQFHRETKMLPVYDLAITKTGLKMKASRSTSQIHFVMDHDHLDATGIAMSNLIRSLAQITGRVVIDRTGLTGRYDVSLSWAPEMDTDDAQSGPSIFTAVQEQLGVKLESAKEPVETVVIDRIDRPTEN